jgi:hypothetical protein
MLILAVSGLFPVVTAFFSGEAAVDYGKYVGVYLFLLSLAVLLPLAFRANTASGSLPLPAAPFVALNFLYFVVGTLMLFASPRARGVNISPSEVPVAMLLLAIGFALYAAGIALSGSGVKKWFPKARDIVTVRGMGILVTVIAGVIWVLRLHFASQGFGITHAGGFELLARNTQATATALTEIQYVPVSLCVARLCNRTLPRSKVVPWQIGLAAVLTSDAFYYVWIGSRLYLFMEFLIVLWAMWLRLLPQFSRRWYLYTGLVLSLAVPVVYAQRAALVYVSPRAGENQLVFTRDYLLPEQARLLQGSAGATMEQGFSRSDTGRMTAVGPVSYVADKIFNDGYPLMWGETLKEGLPFLVPRALWPSKPVALHTTGLMQRHFGLRTTDEVGTIEAETLANFGIVGLCACMFLFGVLTNRFFRYLIKMAPAHEPVALCLLYALPKVFMVETNITGFLGTLRLIPVLFIMLMLISVRHKPLA